MSPLANLSESSMIKIVFRSSYFITNEELMQGFYFFSCLNSAGWCKTAISKDSSFFSIKFRSILLETIFFPNQYKISVCVSVNCYWFGNITHQYTIMRWLDLGRKYNFQNWARYEISKKCQGSFRGGSFPCAPIWGGKWEIPSPPKKKF